MCTVRQRSCVRLEPVFPLPPHSIAFRVRLEPAESAPRRAPPSHAASKATKTNTVARLINSVDTGRCIASNTPPNIEPATDPSLPIPIAEPTPVERNAVG